MNTDLLKARQAVQNAREALQRGERVVARRWAEQAAKLAPQLEDPWLILAAVASPRASVDYLKRALQINPDSPRALKGMQWAQKRLRENPPASLQGQPAIRPQRAAPMKGEQAVGSGRSAAKAKPRQVRVLPVLIFGIGCLVLLMAAWTATQTPVLASILSGPAQQPAVQEHPKVWAQVEIAKPTYTPSPAPTSTLTPTSLPTFTPTIIPTLTATATPEPSVTPESTATPGTLSMEVLVDTPVPTGQPTQASQPGSPAQPKPASGNGVRWIDINLSEQRLYAYEGDVMVRSFVVSTGTWATPTVTGKFKVWIKVPIQDMSGPGYYLPDVPYVMYFYKDYGIHGTYWHNNFGTPMSHGCVNMTILESQWLFNWASVGTVVNVHY